MELAEPLGTTALNGEKVKSIARLQGTMLADGIQIHASRWLRCGGLHNPRQGDWLDSCSHSCTILVLNENTRDLMSLHAVSRVNTIIQSRQFLRVIKE